MRLRKTETVQFEIQGETVVHVFDPSRLDVAVMDLYQDASHQVGDAFATPKEKLEAAKAHVIGSGSGVLTKIYDQAIMEISGYEAELDDGSICTDVATLMPMIPLLHKVNAVGMVMQRRYPEADKRKN